MGGGEGVQESGVRLLWPRTGRDWFVLALAALLVLGIVGNLVSSGQEEILVGQVHLKVPKGFEVRDIPGGKALLAPQEGPGDAFRENLTVILEPLPGPMDGARYAWVVAQRSAQAIQGFQPEQVRPIRVLGGEGVQFSAKGLLGGRSLEWVVMAFVLGQEGYQITLTGEPGKLTAYQAAFQEALAPLALAYGPTPQAPSLGFEERSSRTPSPSVWETPYPAYPLESPPPVEPAFGGEGGEAFPNTSPGYDTSHDDFNTWMSEEWSRVLGGNPPEPSYQDESGNLYWEGPSGLLHEWSPDYPDW